MISRPPLSPDAIEAVVLREPLTEYESVQAAAVFHDLLRQEDPYALTRTIEHVLKMREQDRIAPSDAPPESGAATATYACPFCGSDEPHHHTPQQLSRATDLQTAAHVLRVYGPTLAQRLLQLIPLVTTT